MMTSTMRPTRWRDPHDDDTTVTTIPTITSAMMMGPPTRFINASVLRAVYDPIPLFGPDRHNIRTFVVVASGTSLILGYDNKNRNHSSMTMTTTTTAVVLSFQQQQSFVCRSSHRSCRSIDDDGCCGDNRWQEQRLSFSNNQ